MTLLELNNLNVRLGGDNIVKNLSFRVDDGDWLMIAGPNGAGKTTVVKALSQAVSYRGKVFFSGQDLRRKSSLDMAKLLGVLSQNYASDCPFTAGEIVRLGRYAYSPGPFGLLSAEDEKKIKSAAETTGVEQFFDRPVATLSGGEAQRVFLAQVFAQDPKLLILDEPANHLDLVYQKQVFELVRAWLETPGRAVISVVHDLSLARAFGSRALLMDSGHAAAFGSTSDVLSDVNLNRVYSMDVSAWMRSLLEQWKN
ncbi:MAG: ABC transporter ATP-binding protein [Clostridia bacterium]|nr:ABC transporter ATP-binding protein [Clostridia bacterium]